MVPAPGSRGKGISLAYYGFSPARSGEVAAGLVRRSCQGGWKGERQPACTPGELWQCLSGQIWLLGTRGLLGEPYKPKYWHYLQRQTIQSSLARHVVAILAFKCTPACPWASACEVAVKQKDPTPAAPMPGGAAAAGHSRYCFCCVCMCARVHECVRKELFISKGGTVQRGAKQRLRNSPCQLEQLLPSGIEFPEEFSVSGHPIRSSAHSIR
eukprot:scaffold158840_cov22-Tisochrysis_lutea.AAC.2